MSHDKEILLAFLETFDSLTVERISREDFNRQQTFYRPYPTSHGVVFGGHCPVCDGGLQVDLRRLLSTGHGFILGSLCPQCHSPVGVDAAPQWAMEEAEANTVGLNRVALIATADKALDQLRKAREREKRRIARELKKANEIKEGKPATPKKGRKRNAAELSPGLFDDVRDVPDQEPVREEAPLLPKATVAPRLEVEVSITAKEIPGFS